jgi:hypothetical protein
LFKTLRLNLAKEMHRIMSGLLPQVRVKIPIEGKRFGMPAPPEIICQFIESTNARGHNGEDCDATKDFHRACFLSLCLSQYILLEK